MQTDLRSCFMYVHTLVHSPLKLLVPFYKLFAIIFFTLNWTCSSFYNIYFSNRFCAKYPLPTHKVENLCIREYTSGNSLEYQFFSSLAASNSASTLRLFWFQSQLLILADKPDVYSILLQALCQKGFLILSLALCCKLRAKNSPS